MTSSYGLHGRAALVTGGTRGIGWEEVRRAAAELGGVGLAGSVADPASRHTSGSTSMRGPRPSP